VKVLYVGSTWRGSNAQSWRRSFELLGHEVVAVDPDRVLASSRSIPSRILSRLRGGPRRAKREEFQRLVLDAARTLRPSIVFACKALWLDAATLETMGRNGAARIHWHPDDYRNPQCSSPVFAEALGRYDVVVTPKTYNVAEYVEDGAPRVEYVPYAYDPEVHHPVDAPGGVRFEASFVGGWEPERAAFLEHVASAGVALEVWGAYWHRLPRRSPLRRCCRFREVFAEDMAGVIAASAVTVGFLRKVNRDMHTARTFEIPASGGVMLTERTDEQREFFEEDREALYFGSKEELLDKIRTYAKLPEARRAIREAALLRCRESRYSYQERLQDLLVRLGLT
jgi:glycosyltransferase involved in cell wall biosynthesis